MTTRRGLAAALGLGLAVLGLAAVWGSGGGEREAAPPGRPDPVRTGGPPARPTTTESLEEPAEPRPRRALPPERPGASEIPGSSVVHGRLVDTAGNPVGGGVVRLRMPGGRALDARSDQDGAFELRLHLDRTRSLRLDLDVAAEAFLPATRVRRLEPGEDWDVGECRLFRGGGLLVRVLDAQDADAHRVRVEVLGDGPAVAWEQTEGRGDGTYRFTRVREGPAIVHLDPGSAGARSRSVTVLPDTTVDVAFEPSDRITLDLWVQGYPGGVRLLAESPENVRLIGPDLDRGAAWIPGGFTFDDVPAGVYRAEVRDPRFVPWDRADVHPGSVVHGALEGSATLRLGVVDDGPPDGTRGYRFGIGYDDPGVTDELSWDWQMTASDVVRVVPAHLRVRAMGRDGLLGEVEVPDLAPGEVRDVVVHASRSGSIRGAVRLADGRPAGRRATVYLLPLPSLPSRSGPEASLWTEQADRHGRFGFERLDAGGYRVRASIGTCFGPVLDVTVDPGETVEIELELASESYLSGRLEGLREPQDARLELALDREARRTLRRSLEPWGETSAMAVRGRVGADGSFRLGPLAPGGPYSLRPTFEHLDPGPGLDGLGMHSETRTYELGTYVLAEGENDAGTIDASWTELGSLRLLLDYADESLRSVPPKLWILGREGYRSFAIHGGPEQRLSPLPPGEVGLWIEGDDWITAIPETVSIPPGGEAVVRFRVELAEGSLHILDPSTGGPLAGSDVQLRCHVPPERQADHSSVVFSALARTTDADGVVTARLGLGLYEVQAGGAEWSDPKAIVAWTSSGPVPDEVRLGGR